MQAAETAATQAGLKGVSDEAVVSFVTNLAQNNPGPNAQAGANSLTQKIQVFSDGTAGFTTGLGPNVFAQPIHRHAKRN